MKNTKPLKPEALPVLVEACEAALVYLNELLIDNEIDQSAVKISNKLWRALKKSGRVDF